MVRPAACEDRMARYIFKLARSFSPLEFSRDKLKAV